MLLTLTIPPELAGPLAEEAARRGTTPEALALDAVRQVLPAVAPPAPGKRSLLDRLGKRVGAAAGDGQAWSQDTGRKFTELLVEDLAAKEARQRKDQP